MVKYDFSSMAECNLKSVIDLSREMLGIFSGHYQSQVFNPEADVYFTGSLIEKLREVISEATEELDRRKPKPAMNFKPEPEDADFHEIISDIMNS